MTCVLFGISNCDQVKAARKWLAAHQLSYDFHDLRAEGLPVDVLRQWVERVGLDALLNKRSSTWRQLSPQQQAAMVEGDLALIVQHPTVIKRPVLHSDLRVMVGFSVEHYAALL